MSDQPSKRLKEKHAFFLADFHNIQCAVRDVRVQCLNDRRFYSVPGAQWEGPVGDQFENKPRFEFNKTHLAVLRIINEYRNNRVSVDFVPKDGSDSDELAETCDGLFRADEQDSCAQEAYDNCFEEGTSGGMGAIRLRARYEDEDDDEDDRQRIAIEPVFEADTNLYYSLDGKRQDKSDAKRCYLLTSMTPDDYKNEYGDNPADWPTMEAGYAFEWSTPDVIWIAEVYEVEQKSQTIYFFRGLALDDNEPNEIEVTEEELEAEGKRAELRATGFRQVRKKVVKRPKIHKYMMNGDRILSDEGYIAGKCIPIIPFYGKHWYVDGIERCQGHVRLARDAQVLDNMIKSWLAEMAARFDVEKPILTPEQIAGHAQMWADDAIKKYPYLLVNPIMDASGQQMAAGPVAYTKAPNLPPAMAALAQMAAQSLEDMLGNQQAGEEMQPNQSGKAVELIQNRLDMQVFIYMDNFRKTMKRLGEVWVSMAKDLLVEEGREMKSLDANGQASKIELMKPMMDPETGETYMANDIGKAKFDVSVDVGPSSNSRRAATVRAITGMMQMTADPTDLKVLTSMAMLNLEGEGLSELRPYWRKQLLNLGAVEPTEEEREQIAAAQEAAAQQPPDAQTQFLQASAAKAMADAGKSQADQSLTEAKVIDTRANTIATLSEIEQNRQAQAFEQARVLSEPSHSAEQQPQPEQPPAQ